MRNAPHSVMGAGHFQRSLGQNQVIPHSGLSPHLNPMKGAAESTDWARPKGGEDTPLGLA